MPAFGQRGVGAAEGAQRKVGAIEIVRRLQHPNQLPMPAAENLNNAPEFTVSELSSALKRTVEDAYGMSASAAKSPASADRILRPLLFRLKDDSAKIEAVIWKACLRRMRFKPQEGLEVIATGKSTTYPGSRNTRSSSKDGARRHRRADGADGGAQAETRAPRPCSTRRASNCCPGCRR